MMRRFTLHSLRGPSQLSPLSSRSHFSPKLVRLPSCPQLSKPQFPGFAARYNSSSATAAANGPKSESGASSPNYLNQTSEEEDTLSWMIVSQGDTALKQVGAKPLRADKKHDASYSQGEDRLSWMVVNQGGAALKEGGAMPQQQSQKGASSDETNDKKARKLAKTDAKDVPGPGDHRTIGKEQDLFTISEYSPGSPLMLPNGTYILNKLVAFLRAQYVQYGFQEVSTPNIYKKSLWERSGHYQNYSEDMYEVKPGFKNASLDQGEMETKAGEGEPEESYGLKPMNCPGHCVLFKQKMHSFRELPVRYADFSALHRNEVSGSLSGLTRVRRFHQDDAHIFCRPHQIAGEIRTQLQFTDIVMKVFGLTDYRLVLSTRPESGYIGDIDMWNDAERQLTEALNKSGRKWTINEGDGAFYGPKIDLQVKDSDGKLHQLSTIQLDMNLPRRFKLQYRVTYGQPEYNRPFPYEDLQQSRPVMIHRAIFGSLERFFALLIEHYEGRWPFWLNPNPVALMSVNTAPELVDYAKAAAAKISGLPSHRNTRAISPTVPTYRVDVNLMPETLRKKIKVARNKKYNIAIVVGHGELQDNTVNIDYSGQAATKGFKGLDETLKGLRVTMYDTLAKKLTMHVDDVYEWLLRLERSFQ